MIVDSLYIVIRILDNLDFLFFWIIFDVWKKKQNWIMPKNRRKKIRKKFESSTQIQTGIQMSIFCFCF